MGFISQILMNVQSNQTNVMRLMLTVAILLVAMRVNVMLASLEMVVTAVICKIGSLVHYITTMQSAVCDDGDVLLYNGTTASANLPEGTVLVCYDNEYGTVCDDFWDTLDASVVCNQLHNTSIGESLCVTQSQLPMLGWHLNRVVFSPLP